MPDPRSRLTVRKGWGAFSLLEVLVATSVLVIIMVVIFSMTQQISGAWRSSTAKIEAFQGGRGAFDAMSRQIGLATLNTYYDYFDLTGKPRGALASGTFVPHHYGRYSDLHFITGKSLVTSPAAQVGHAIFFQAPLGYTDDIVNYGGMQTLLNACGYFVVYDKDNSRPKFLDDGVTIPKKPADRYRFRLMQFFQPDQRLAVYSSGATDWFTTPLASASPPVRIMAENVVAVILLPKLSKVEESTQGVLAKDYEYNTRPALLSGTQGKVDYQLPPVVEVIMVAIDEPSAQRICTTKTAPDLGLAALFQTLDPLDPQAQLEKDLDKLTATLRDRHITYRVFRSEVALRGAKWSS